MANHVCDVNSSFNKYLCSAPGHITRMGPNICTFAVLFFEILFFQPILFHIISAEERYIQGYCIPMRCSFFE